MEKKNLQKPIDGIYDVPKLKAKAVSACLWRAAVERPSVQTFRLKYLAGAPRSRKNPPAWISEPLDSTDAGKALQSAASAIVAEVGIGINDAAALILYNSRPAPPKAVKELKRYLPTFAGAGVTIDLRVSLAASEDEVIKAFRKLRGELLGRAEGERERPLTPKHLVMAMHYAEHEETGCTSEAMKKWNRQHPEWSYRAVKTFNRDQRAAFSRVLNPPKVFGAFFRPF